MPSTFETVAQAVAEVGWNAADRGFVFQDLEGNETEYLFPDIARETSVRAAALQAHGLRKGDRVGLIVIEPEDFVLTFLAALRAGIVPVPLYPPMSFASLDAYVDRNERILTQAGASLLVASERLLTVLWSLADRVPTLKQVVAAPTLRTCDAAPTWEPIVPADLAFLQYTSGSTADPKGVMVTHASLVANARGIIDEALQMVPGNGDKAISWLPLYHDMGLIGFVIAPILHSIPTVFIPTLRFIKRPSVWLDTIHRHRGTVTFAPNFAFALATKRVRDEDLTNWDLSCLAMVGCGAEPIQPATVRAFTDLFSTRCKMPTNAVTPAYGMAEATLAMSIKRRPDTWEGLVVDAESFQADGTVRDAIDGQLTAEHVACGAAFSGHEIRVLGADGQWLPDGREGELCFKGPSVTLGYFQNPQATAEAYRPDGFLRTGDLGYVRDGQVVVTGRIKDLIIVNGRNLHPQALEWCVAELDGVRRGNVVAFSVPGEAGEEVVVVAETRANDQEAVVEAIRSKIRKELSVSVIDVVCLPAGSLPKTSSGKLQRRKTRQDYLEGKLGAGGNRLAGAQAGRLALAKHMARGVWARAKAATLGT